EMFYLNEIARLKPALTGGTRSQYEPYVPDEEKIKARPDFVDQLLRSLKEKGDTTITWDRPESIYYVVLLTDIAKPNEDRFYSEYSNLHLTGQNLWQIMESERRYKYHQAVLKQMRADAGAANGRWDVPDDVRKRIEG